MVYRFYHQNRLSVRYLLAVLLVSLFCAFPGSLKASIFGIDDRKSTAANNTHFRAVGVIRTHSGGYGTAFLIDECHVLTAKHVIHEANPLGTRMSVRFEPWIRPGHDNTSLGTVIGRLVPPSDYSEDWALLRLDYCLGFVLAFSVGLA